MANNFVHEDQDLISEDYVEELLKNIQSGNFSKENKIATNPNGSNFSIPSGARDLPQQQKSIQPYQPELHKQQQPQSQNRGFFGDIGNAIDRARDELGAGLVGQAAIENQKAAQGKRDYKEDTQSKASFMERERARKMAEYAQNNRKFEVENWRDINGIGSAGTWAAEQLVSGLPQFAGDVATLGSPTAGRIYAEQKGGGNTQAAELGGAASAALGLIPVGKPFAPIVKQAGIKGATGRLIENTVTGAGGGVASGAAYEAGRNEAVDSRMFDNALDYAVTGGALSGGLSLVTEAGKKYGGNSIKAVEDMGGDVTASEPYRHQAMRNFQRNQELMEVMNKEMTPEMRESVVTELNDINNNIGGSALYKAYSDLKDAGVVLSPAAFRDLEVRQNLSSTSPVIGKASDFMGITEKEAKKGDTRHSISKTSTLGEFDFGSKIFSKEELGKFRQKGKESQAKDMAAFDDILAQLRQSQIKIEAEVRSGSGISKEGAAPQISKIKEISEYLKRIKEFASDTNSNRTLIYDAMNENAKRAAEEIAKLGLGVDGKAFNPVMNAASYIMKDKLLVNQDPAYHFGTLDTRDKAFSLKDVTRMALTANTFGASEIPGFLARRSENKARKKIAANFDELKAIAKNSDSPSIVDRVKNVTTEAPRATEAPTRFEEQQAVRQEAEAKQAAELATSPIKTGEQVVYNINGMEVPAIVKSVRPEDNLVKIEVGGKESFVSLDELSKDSIPVAKEEVMATPLERDTLKTLGMRDVEIDTLTSDAAKNIINELQARNELKDIASLQYRKTPEKVVEEAPVVEKQAPDTSDLRDIASLEGGASLRNEALRQEQNAASAREITRERIKEAYRQLNESRTKEEPTISQEDLRNLAGDESQVLNRERIVDEEVPQIKEDNINVDELPKEDVRSIDMTQDLMSAIRDEASLDTAKALREEKARQVKEESLRIEEEAKKLVERERQANIDKAQTEIKHLSDDYSIKKSERVEADLKELETSKVEESPEVKKAAEEILQKKKPTQEEIQALIRDWKPVSKEAPKRVGTDSFLHQAAENSEAIKVIQERQKRAELDRKLLDLGVDKEKVKDYNSLDKAKEDLKAQRLAEEKELSDSADLAAAEFKAIANETQSAGELARERYVLDKSVEYGLDKVEFNTIADAYRNTLTGRLDNLTKVEMRQIIKQMQKYSKDVSKSRLKEEQVAAVTNSEYLTNKAEKQIALLDDFADSIGLPKSIADEVIEAATLGNVSPLKVGEMRSTANKLISKREAYLRNASKEEQARLSGLESSPKTRKIADKLIKETEQVSESSKAVDKQIDELRNRLGELETKKADKKTIDEFIESKSDTEIQAVLDKLLPEIEHSNNKLLSEMTKLANKAVENGKATIQTVQIANQLKLIDETVKTINKRKEMGYGELVDGADGLYTGADQAKLKAAFGSGSTTNYMGSANKRMIFEAYGKYSTEARPMWASTKDYLAKKQELESPMNSVVGESTLKPTKQTVDFEQYTPREQISADSGLVVRASFTPAKGLSSVSKAIDSGYVYAIVDPSKETIIDYAKNQKMANNLTKKGLTVAIPLLTMLSGTAMASNSSDTSKDMKYDASKIGTIKGTPYTEAIGYSEARGQYNIENSLGYLGKFQMGWPAMVELGFIKRDKVGKGHKGILGNPDNWTGKYGIYSKEQYLNSPEAQEAAMRDMVALSDKLIVKYGLDKYVGQVIDGVPITWNGLRASSHLAGHGGLRQALKNNDLSFADGYGTTIRKYMKYGATIPDDNA